MTHTITRERVTWIHPTDHRGKTEITHPMMWVISEDGVVVKYCDTRREAAEWIAQEMEVHLPPDFRRSTVEEVDGDE